VVPGSVLNLSEIRSSRSPEVTPRRPRVPGRGTPSHSPYTKDRQPWPRCARTGIKARTPLGHQRFYPSCSRGSRKPTTPHQRFPGSNVHRKCSLSVDPGACFKLDGARSMMALPSKFRCQTSSCDLGLDQRLVVGRLVFVPIPRSGIPNTTAAGGWRRLSNLAQNRVTTLEALRDHDRDTPVTCTPRKKPSNSLSPPYPGVTPEGRSAPRRGDTCAYCPPTRSAVPCCGGVVHNILCFTSTAVPRYTTRPVDSVAGASQKFCWLLLRALRTIWQHAIFKGGKGVRGWYIKRGLETLPYPASNPTPTPT